MNDAALKMWKDKLEFLQIELAKAVDPEAKFKLHKAIEEAEAEIAKLSGTIASEPSRKISGTQLEKHAPRVLFGRETELAALDAAWAKGTLNVYTLAAFFDEPWSKVSPKLSEADQAWLLNEAALRLRALGRLTEALQPMRAGLEMAVRLKDWQNAAIYASNLSDLEVTLGRLPDAVTDAHQSITYADQSGARDQRMLRRTTAADALHQSGQRAEAGTLLADAERMQKERQPEFELLYSLQGFRYCDWLLAPAEHAAWQHFLNQHLSNSRSQISDCLAEVERRATTTLSWSTPRNLLLDIALDHLTLARAGLIRAILANSLPQPTLDLPHVAAAVNGLRAAGQVPYLPLGLLTASLYHFVRGEHDLARKHLAEAQQIAERGPMPLFLADIHLHRARMFHDKTELAQAAKLIRTLAYGRRTEELLDAEQALR